MPPCLPFPPSLPPGSDAMTVSGCPIDSVEVNAHTLSEVLRLYLEDRAEADMDHVSQSTIDPLTYIYSLLSLTPSFLP